MSTAITGDSGLLTALAMLKRMNGEFCDKCEWDAKVELGRVLGVQDEQSMWFDNPDGSKIRYDAYGNIQYGAMMSQFGITETNAVLASRGPDSGNPDPGDDIAIRLGYQLHARYPAGFTQSQSVIQRLRSSHECVRS